MISVTQAADVMGITRAAIYKAIERGALEAIRIGNVTIVTRASANAYHEPAGVCRERRARCTSGGSVPRI